MKKIILITIIIGIVIIAAITIITKLSINHLQEEFDLTQSQTSHNNISYSKIRLTFHKGIPGIYLENLLLKKKSTKNDSIFYSEKLLINSGFKIFSKNLNSKIVFINPHLHIYPEKSPLEDSTEIENADFVNFNKIPEIYAKSLDLTFHNDDTTIRIENTHFKLKPKNEKLSLNIKHQHQGYSINAGTLFEIKKQAYFFEDGFIKINNEKLVNLNLSVEKDKSQNKYKWDIFSDSTDISVFSNDRIKYSGYFNLKSEGFYSENKTESNTIFNLRGKAKSDCGKIDSLIIHLKNIVKINKKDSIIKLVLNSDISGKDSYANLKIRRHKNDTINTFELESKANITTEQLFVWNDNISGKIISDHKISLADNYKENETGKTNAKLFYVQKNSDKTEIDFSANAVLNEINIKKKDCFNYKFKYKNLSGGLIFSHKYRINAKLWQNKLIVPQSNSGTKLDYSGFQEATDDTKLNRLPQIPQIKLKWEIDSIIYDKKTISKNNIINANLIKGLPSANVDLNLSGNLKGPLRAEIHSHSKDKINGEISSKGLKISDKSKLPLISKNLELKKETGTVNKFTIPFTYRDSLLNIPVTSIVADNFIIHISGKANKNNIAFNAGLTAPTDKFKGPAVFVLNKKESLNTVETVLLKIKRKDNKWDFKAVPAND